MSNVTITLYDCTPIFFLFISICNVIRRGATTANATSSQLYSRCYRAVFLGIIFWHFVPWRLPKSVDKSITKVEFMDV